MPEDKKKCRFYELQVGEEDENKPLRDVTYGNVWFRFTDITSAHGVPHIKNARGIFKLLVWCGAVMVSIALLIIVVKPLIEKYLAFGVNVRVDVLYEPQITFPAVTVCNMNPIRYSQITKNDKLNDILGTPSTGTGDSSSISTSGSTMTPSPVETLTPAPSPTPTPTPSPTPTPAPSPTPTPTPSPTPVPAPSPTPTPAPSPTPTPTPSPTPTPAPSPTPTPTPSPSPTGRKRRNVDPSTDSTDAAVSGDGSGLANEESSGYGTGSGPGLKSTNIQPKSDGRQASANFELRNKVMKVLSEMSLEEKAPLGHQQDDFVLTCEYSGYDCLDYAFTTFYNNEYGNCFSFNSGWNSSLALETAFRPGPPNGLHITMNIDQDDYTGDLATSAGVRVIIHPQEKMPFPEDEGVSASPGQLTMIGVRKLTIHREGGDYGNCTDIQVHNYSRNVYEERYPVNYSSNACYKTCYQYNLMATCHCADMSYPLYGQAFAEFGNLNLENRTFDACDITNTNQTDCMTTVEDLFHNNELSCDCPQACDETSFITSVSTSYWPSDSYRSTLFEALASENEMVKHVLNSVDDPDKYQKNLLKVVVYFEEFNYEAISESPAYLIENLISDFGGILGLFLGFSVLTIIEVVELGLDVVILSCIKICCRGKKRDSVSPTPSEGHRMIVSTTHLHNDDLYATKNSAPPPYMHLPESKITPLA